MLPRRRLVKILVALAVTTSTLVSSVSCAGSAPVAPTAAPTAAATAAPPAATAALTAAPTTAPTAASAQATATPATAVKAESLKPPGSDQAATATPRKSATLERSTVDAMWVSTGPSGAKGGTSPVVVNVEKNDTRELRVGFYEEEVGGSGPMWRAAGWMAVIMSSFLLGIDPVDYRYTYDVGGSIDGPSAGGLMTVATMSSLMGTKVKADATMTGTINPDGTIGPVGGIPHKIDGAAAKGKTLILVPAGSRMSTDLNTKQQVDVIERGRRLNVTVKEVSDVYEAYELLTGQPLPKPAGLKEVRPELPAAAFDRTKGKAKEWFTRYWQLQGQYNALPANARYDFTDTYFETAKASGDKADSYFQQGLASSAYNQAVDATLNASIGYQTSKVLESYMNGGMDGAIGYMKSMQTVNLKVDAMIDRLQTQKPTTLSDSIALADAYGSVNLAMSLSGLANDALQTKVQTKEDAMAVLAIATLYYTVADHAIELSKDAIDVGWGFGTAPAPSDEKIASLSELFRRAAEADLNYFDAVVLNDVAQGAGVSVDVVKSKFANQDFSYTFAITSLRNLNDLKQRAGPGVYGNYATFGGAMNSYVLSSGLVAKYYSLGVQVDKDGTIKGISNERGMINMLDFAEKRSKEMIGLAVALNADPVHPVLLYEQGKTSREGNVDQKFSALTDYWHSVMESQAIAVLSGKANVTTK